MPVATMTSIERRCQRDKEKIYVVIFSPKEGMPAACSKPAEFRQAKYVLENQDGAGRTRTYWRPNATPKSTGGSVVELQRQLPLPVF
jgi:hypothetical protein